MKAHAVFATLAACTLLVSGCGDNYQTEAPTNGPQLTLASAEQVVIPETPVAGMVAGKPFQPNKTEFSGQLEFAQGEDFFADTAVTVFLFLNGESVAGRQWLIDGNENKYSNPHIHVRYKQGDDESTNTEIFTEDYTLNLQFGEIDDHGKVTGRIFLQIEENPSAEIAGTFVVDAPADRKVAPPVWQRPYVISQVQLPDENRHDITTGYFGITDAGEKESNLAGMGINPGDAFFMSSNTYSPRVSAFGWNELYGIHGRHVRLTPGKYVFYATEGDTFVNWQIVDVRPDTGLELEFDFDFSQAGSLTVTIPEDDDSYASVRVAPLNEDGTSLLNMDGLYDYYTLSAMIEPADPEFGEARFSKLAPGNYRVYFGEETADVVIDPNGEAFVNFAGDQ